MRKFLAIISLLIGTSLWGAKDFNIDPWFYRVISGGPARFVLDYSYDKSLWFLGDTVNTTDTTSYNIKWLGPVSYDSIALVDTLTKFIKNQRVYKLPVIRRVQLYTSPYWRVRTAGLNGDSTVTVKLVTWWREMNGKTKSAILVNTSIDSLLIDTTSAFSNPFIKR